MTIEDHRLIEDYLPIKAISKEASREKSIRNNEKNVPTYFFTYNSRNRFILNREEESPHLHFFDLVGNFKIDWKESERILKDYVISYKLMIAIIYSLFNIT